MSLFSYLITFLGILFWFFRAIATLLFQLDVSFFAQPINTNTEIAVLFITLPCMVLIIKRNIVGAAIYFAVYATYFGTALYNTIMTVGFGGLDIASSANLLFTVIGVILPALTFLDVLLNKNRTLGNGKKREDWFYANKDYDRQFDERADRNQYKF